MTLRIPEPAVSRKALLRSAAAVWGLAGMFLSVRAALWLRTSDRDVRGLILLALGIGFLKGKFVFAQLARRNIHRIREISPHKAKICLFAFQAIQSYVTIAVMIVLGILLRRTPIPREYLAVIYLAIGIALLYGSLRYWRADRI